jgi:hypothetical protein
MSKAAFSSMNRARVHGAPGTSPRLRGLLQSLLPLAVCAAGGGWLVRAMWPAPAMTSSVAALLLSLLTIGTAVWLIRSQSRMKDYLKGARGEQRIAFELAGLDDRFDVFHGIPLAEKNLADCDHIVVGPTGVFVVETKNWMAPVSVKNGDILYDGQIPDRPPLPQVKRAASGLRDVLARALRLDIPIRPVLCFVDATLPETLRGVDGVILCRATTIRDVFLSDPDRPIDETSRGRVVEHLRKLAEAG